MYKRLFKLDLPTGQSAFLWGARQTGKSAFLKSHFPDSYYVDLLDTEIFLTYNKEPYLFRKHIEALPLEKKQKPIIVDEIQKIPLLLNEVHALIESEKIGFILCGSSARRLRAVGVNLLGGRAWKFSFFPLTSREIEDFDLLRALSHGLLPSIYLSPHFARTQRAYITTYLKDEIQTEGLVRNLSAFSKFLDVVGFTHGGMVNYANISNEVGVTANTVKEYYQILVDTLLGYQIYPYRKQVKRQIVSSAPRFYLFDVGIANHLAKKTIVNLAGPDAGAAFEHFILMELVAYRGIQEKDFEISYWRTKTGLEVDFILGRGEIAIEVKISTIVRQPVLKGLEAFMEEHHPKHAIVVSQDLARRHIETEHGIIEVIPWKEFLDELWDNRFL